MQSPGHGIDLWIVGLHIITISSVIGAINFICTIHNMRAPGMRLTRMPLFVWTVDVYAFMLLLALPLLSGALTMLLLDRNYGTTFYAAGHYGPLLYQHLFWAFGHPEVYVVALPGFGMISEIVPVFSRKPLFGYRALVYATVAIAFLGFLVWGHHMFAVGMSTPLQVWFMLTSMAIAVPTGVKIFNWIGTMWMGQIRFEPPMLFATGFILVFLIGGLSGIALAIFPFDLYVTDSYFVVAHFHYVMGSIPVFAVLGGAALLVSEDDRPDARPDARDQELLGALRRLQPHLLPDARDGPLGDAAPRRHVHGSRLERLQPDRDARRVRARDRRAHGADQLPAVAASRADRPG